MANDKDYSHMINAPRGVNDEDKPLSYLISQFFSASLTAQHGCPVHEHCDSSCPRLGQDNSSDSALATSIPGLGRKEPLVLNPDTPGFTYTPLKDAHKMIRLLKIKPAIFRADLVDCELTHHSCNNLPKYGALSYCWGTGLDRCKVLCNGKVFLARQNLEDALKRLRAGFGPGQREEYIWADAICINQKDLAERSEQIPLMKHIYSQAQTVYVDLGDSEGDLGPSAYLSDGLNTLRFTTGASMGSSTMIRPYFADHPLDYKTAFLSLTKSWFTRTWIIQEIVLAKKVRLMFQGNVFDKTQFDAHLNPVSIMLDPAKQQELMLNKLSARGFMNYDRMQQIRRLWLAGPTNSFHLLQLTRDFAVTEPKDKIFGLMALMTDSERASIGPYLQPVGTIYRRFAALHVRQGRGVDVLDCAGSQRRRLTGENLPSWVPDWTAQANSIGGKAISTLRPVRYAAASSQDPLFHLLGDETGSAGLSARGIVFDSLRSVHDMFKDDTAPDFFSIHKRIANAFADEVKLGPSVYADPIDAYARLLLMDDTYQGPNAINISSPIVDPTKMYYAAITSWRAGKRFFPRAAKWDAVETYKMQSCTACTGRRFAVTHKGYLALVPRLARHGDVVALFYGATVPYIIRRAEKNYSLVGDTYVQGIMSGEAVSMMSSEAQDILLV